jgi:hypothetical protein
MKDIWAFFVLLAVPINSGYAQLDPTKLIPETLHYRLLSGSVEVGSSIVTISRNPSNGMIHIVESISGLFEQTAIVAIRDDTSLQPLSSHIIISRDNKYHEAKLQYHENAQRVTGKVQRPAEFGGSRLIDTELLIGVVDIYAIPYFFRAAPLLVNRTLQIPFFNAMQNEKGLARAWISRLESITVPVGTFKCFRLEAFIGNSRLLLNYDTQFPHRLIRQIFPELEVKFELVKIE